MRRHLHRTGPSLLPPYTPQPSLHLPFPCLANADSSHRAGWANVHRQPRPAASCSFHVYFCSPFSPNLLLPFTCLAFYLVLADPSCWPGWANVFWQHRVAIHLSIGIPHPLPRPSWLNIALCPALHFQIPHAGLVGPMYIGNNTLVTEAGGIVFAEAGAANFGRGFPPT